MRTIPTILCLCYCLFFFFFFFYVVDFHLGKNATNKQCASIDCCYGCCCVVVVVVPSLCNIYVYADVDDAVNMTMRWDTETQIFQHQEIFNYFANYRQTICSILRSANSIDRSNSNATENLLANAENDAQKKCPIMTTKGKWHYSSIHWERVLKPKYA